MDALHWEKNSLLILINHQPGIDKIYLYNKDLKETKYQFLIKKHDGVVTIHFNGSKAFVEHSNNIIDIYQNIEEFNPNNGFYWYDCWYA